MQTVMMFRLLVVASLVLGLIGAFLDTIVPGVIPKVLEDAYKVYTDTDEGWGTAVILGVAAIGLLVAGIAATVGLLQLKRWSRSLALWVTIGAFATHPLIGVTLQSGWAFVLTEVSTAMWGAVLAMAYYSELKTHFEVV